MGGGGDFHPFAYPKYVWAPTGGWWANPSKWKRNTAFAVVGVACTAVFLATNWKSNNTAFVEQDMARFQADRARAYMRWVRRQPAERQAEIQAAMEANRAERERFAAGDYLAAELAGPPAAQVFSDLGFKTINYVEAFHAPDYAGHRGRI